MNEYCLTKAEPAALSDSQKAAAVQAAIWFFSDRYVLSTGDPLHDVVAGIVSKVQSEGVLPTPPPPSLTITPPLQTSGPLNAVLGPYHVASTDPSVAITVSADGAQMYSDPGGTPAMLIPNNSPLPTTGDVYLKSGAAGTATLHATGTATVPAGNVYLSVNGVNANQKLILASGGKLTTTVDAAAQFLAPPSLIVYKIIQGPASGLQGQIQIDVTCGTTKLESFIINAKATAGTRSKVYSVPAGTRSSADKPVCSSNRSRPNFL